MKITALWVRTWVRRQVDYRFGTAVSGDWYYRLDTLDLGHGRLEPDVFLGTPTHHVDERESPR